MWGGLTACFQLSKRDRMQGLVLSLNWKVASKQTRSCRPYPIRISLAQEISQSALQSTWARSRVQLTMKTRNICTRHSTSTRTTAVLTWQWEATLMSITRESSMTLASKTSLIFKVASTIKEGKEGWAGEGHHKRLRDQGETTNCSHLLFKKVEPTSSCWRCNRRRCSRLRITTLELQTIVPPEQRVELCPQ